jgi:CRP/FNR family transcriptional regulator, anaerobic regulatory protein
MKTDRLFNRFFNCIEQITPLTESDKQLCRTYFEVAEFSKNTLIEKAGTIHLYQNFVLEGYLRKFKLDDHAQDITIDINTEPCFFTSYNAMMERTISDENIEAITDSVLLRIKRDDIDILLENSKSIHTYTVLLFQKVITERSQQIFDFANSSAKDRYLKFQKKHPDLIKNIPLQHIASYLGITPQSLSRIRTEILQQK